jgi:hypothetical protein
VQNISFKNIHVQDVAELIAGTNVPAARMIDGFSLANISGTCSSAIALANMTNVNLSKITVTGFAGALVSASNVHGTGLDDSAAK